MEATAAKVELPAIPTPEGFEAFLEARSTEEVVLRVANSSDVKLLAASISFALQDSRRVTLRAVGAGAVNQMAKACAIARTYVAGRGVDLSVRPGFTTVMMPDLTDSTKKVEQTALIFIVKVE